MPKLEVVNANNVIEFNPQKANFKLKNTGGPKGETGAQGPKGDTGPQGLQGPAGASASVTVGSTTTLSPGAAATVTNSGDTRNAILNFGIPTGARGPKGDTGSKGDTGPMGPKGEKGDTGAAATVQVGNTNTGAPGTNAQVTNAGNEHFAVFNFTIPRGDKGEKGDTGAQGPKGPAGQDGTDGFSPIATVTQEGLDAEISITDKDGTTTATVPGFGVQVVESLPATGSSNVIYLERDSNSASGNPISIADAVEAPLKSLEIQGNTSQQTYSGKNLYPLIASTTNNGITYTQNADGTYNISGTSTAQANAILWLGDISAFVDGQTYTISVSPAPTNMSVLVEAYNGTTWQRTLFDTNATNPIKTSAINMANADRLKFSLRVGSAGRTVNLQNLKIQLEKGSSATEWERYVGGTASPNPDYPQAVNTVTGENVVKICGKNLADIPDFSVAGSGYAIGASNGAVSVDSTTTNRAISLCSGADGGTWLPAYTSSSVIDHHITGNGGSYTISLANVAKTITGTQAFYVSVYTNKRSVANTTLTSSSNFSPSTITLDSDEHIKDIWIWVGGNTTYNVSFTIQLELGSSASSFEPYQGQNYEVNLGNIELCKIGNYQDYIYKSDGKWYVHKEIGKTTLVGTEQIALGGTSTSGKYRFNITVSGVANIASTERVSYSNNFISATRNETYACTQGMSLGQNLVQIYCNETASYDLDQFKAWLASHNTTVYYPLATPTDTEITNEALIEQLEAVLAGGTQAGANTITLTPSAGATGTLEVEYYDSYDSYLWVNNRWEKFAHLG